MGSFCSTFFFLFVALVLLSSVHPRLGPLASNGSKKRKGEKRGLEDINITYYNVVKLCLPFSTSNECAHLARIWIIHWRGYNKIMNKISPIFKSSCGAQVDDRLHVRYSNDEILVTHEKWHALYIANLHLDGGAKANVWCIMWWAIMKGGKSGERRKGGKGVKRMQSMMVVFYGFPTFKGKLFQTWLVEFSPFFFLSSFTNIT